MSVFAPDEAMFHSGNHPPLEELAAYIDGLLEEKEAARVAEHISECEDCFFVYSETVRFQLEHPSEAADPTPEVIPFPAKTQEKKVPRISPWLLAAAAVLAVVSGISLYRGFGSQNLPQITTAELTDPIQGVPDLQNRLYPLKTFRGGEGDSEFDRQSFMTGVLLVDLRLSLEAGDAEKASERLQKIGAVLLNIGGMDDAANSLIQEADRIKSATDLQPFLAKLSQWEMAAGEGKEEVWVVDPDYVTFGKWAEAARLAAVLQTPEFFNSRRHRKFLSNVLKKEMAPDEEVVKDLREIERIWDRDDLQAQDFATLADKFASIIRAYDFTS